MRRATRSQPIRNKIDLANPGQVRAWTKHLDISRADLHRLIEKVGNSISALTKEIAIERAHAQPAAAPKLVQSAEPKLNMPVEGVEPNVPGAA